MEVFLKQLQRRCISDPFGLPYTFLLIPLPCLQRSNSSSTQGRADSDREKQGERQGEPSRQIILIEVISLSELVRESTQDSLNAFPTIKAEIILLCPSKGCNAHFRVSAESTTALYTPGSANWTSMSVVIAGRALQNITHIPDNLELSKLSSPQHQIWGFHGCWCQLSQQRNEFLSIRSHSFLCP